MRHMNRRSFLKLTGGAIAAASLVPELSFPKDKDITLDGLAHYLEKNGFHANEGYYKMLDAGSENAGRQYIILGSVTGTYPGTTLPGGLQVPLNRDFFTDLMRQWINSTFFQEFYGTLDAEGQATATMYAPPAVLLPLSLRTLNLAYVLLGPADFASNAVPIQLVP